MSGLHNNPAQQLSRDALLQRYEYIVNSVDDMMSVINRRYEYEVVNDSWCRATQRAREDVIGRKVRDLWIDEVFEQSLKPHLEACFRGETSSYRTWVTSSSGKRSFRELHLYPVRDGAGEVLYAICVNRDITASHDAERRYQFLVNSITDLMCMVDRDGVFLAVNDAWCEVFRLGRQNFTGQKLEDAVGIILYEKDIRPSLQRCLQGSIESCNVWLLLASHGLRHCHFTFYPYQGEGGAVTQAVIVVRDTTREKQAEDELMSAHKLAIEASRAKSAFLANMSHEIRTPMNAVIGMNYLMQQTRLTSKQKGYSDKIAAAADGLLQIINDILDFSKIESGKIELEKIDFRLEDVIGYLAQLTAVQAHEKKLEFSISVAPDVPDRLIGDPLRLRQILVNLTSNAIKFTPKGEVIVSINVESTSPESSILRFSVRDTGIGLNDAQKRNLFESFSQADTSTTRRYGGTGLGLAISLRLVHLMDGTISVKSDPGEGSTFTFTARFGKPAAKSGTGMYSKLPFAGKRALIVDANAASLEALVNMIKSLAMGATVASSTQEVLDQFQSNPQGFDLLILDSTLSGMGWLPLVREIDVVAPRKCPSIILTAPAENDELKSELEEAGLDGILIKPVTRSVLLDTIMQSFARHSQIVMPRDALKADTPLHLHRIIPGSLRVLLVEDNEVNRQVAVEILSLAGCEVTCAVNGKVAVDLLAARTGEMPFDVVLMDLQMPEMDGFEATRQIRANARFARLPILAMTADAVSGVNERCIECGMNAYLTKPVKIDELYEALGNWAHLSRRVSPAQHTERSGGTPAAEALLPPRESKIKEVPVSSRRRPHSRRPLSDKALLNTVAGIARIGGNRVLYERLLRQFVTKYRHVDVDIDAALEKDQKAEATRLAHTIKGVAGNLDISVLYKVAADWERRLHDAVRAPDYEDVREHFRTILNDSVAAIDRFLGGVEPALNAAQTAAGHRAISAPIDELIRQLRPKLESNDMDAVRLARELETWLAGKVSPELTNPLIAAIERFEYDEALAILKRIESGELKS